MSNKKEIRKNFREAVYKRDGYCCRICGYKPSEENLEKELDAHHITDRNEMPGGGYVKENGISLCSIPDGGCHMNAEMFHISDGQEWVPGLHPDELYELIGSSKKLAIEASEKLK